MMEKLLLVAMVIIIQLNYGVIKLIKKKLLNMLMNFCKIILLVRETIKHRAAGR